MILSASRRTDLPAFYTEWFLHRLREGFALARGPYASHRLTRIPLRPGTLDGAVFWSKNPGPLLEGPGREALALLKEWDVPYYIQFTLNPYGPELEPGLPPTAERIRVFRRLADRLGPERLVWRYDPVVVNERCTMTFHKAAFARLAGELAGCTDECVFSFLDLYAKAKRRSAGLADRPVPPETMEELAASFAETAAGTGLRLRTCCEAADFSRYGIRPGACIDTERLERLSSRRLACRKDPGQRPGCGCAQSVDIGGYDTCTHGCVYCYATSSGGAAARNRAAHDPLSPLLTGWPGEGDVIVERKAVSRSEESGQLVFTD